MESLHLYHFTDLTGLALIQASGQIQPNVVATAGATVALHNRAIALTKTPSPVGQGITDGRSITEAEAAIISHRKDGAGQYFSLDRAEYRLSVPMPLGDPALESFYDHFKGRQNFELLKLGIDIAGYLCYGSKPDAQVQSLGTALHSGKLVSMVDSSYFYTKPIPFLGLLVEQRQANGTYL